MTFKESLEKLNIADYGEAIFHSNSHGELFHCEDYVCIASVLGDDTEWFREWFIEIVKEAKENWSRPESVYQHMPRILQENCEA